MGLGVFGLEHEHIVELLDALGAVLEHHAHGAVAVDVGVFALEVAVGGLGKGDVLVDLHQAGLHIAGTGALGTIQNVRFCGAHIAVLDEGALHQILDLLHGRGGTQGLVGLGGHLPGQHLANVHALGLMGGGEGLLYGLGNLVLVKRHEPAVPLHNRAQHLEHSPLF